MAAPRRLRLSRFRPRRLGLRARTTTTSRSALHSACCSPATYLVARQTPIRQRVGVRQTYVNAAS
jgi:hypothetical protein